MMRSPTLLALVLAIAGCLDVPDSTAPMCHATSDCDSGNGEVCEDGVCWGNPPPGTFAAIIAPPASRSDLAISELPQVALPTDGWMGTLALDRSVQLSGKIVAYCAPPMTSCDGPPLAANVAVSRRSQFQGGPGFQTVVPITADADSFSLSLPVTGTSDDAYIVTIVPDGTSPPVSGQSSAERVPPLRTTISVMGSTSRTIQLGGPDLPVVSGHLTNALGQGLAGWRVVAVGRWDPTEAATEVSTVAYTDSTGKYALTLSADLVDKVEIVARPRAPLANLPPTYAATIHIPGVDATSSSSRDVSLPASLGVPVDAPLEVKGPALSGDLVPAVGASVTVSGTLTTAGAVFTFTDTQVVGSNGIAPLHVLNGAGLAAGYHYSVTPPASSSMTAVYWQALKLPIAAPVQLRSRVALRGRVLDAGGHALKNVAVTARPSLRFLWSLDASQTFVESIPASTTVTEDKGDFVVFVDGSIDGVPGRYDLMIEPPTSALAPTFTRGDVSLPSASTLTAFDTGDITLPAPAYVHGKLTDPFGTVVENAELKLYALSTALDVCSEVDHAPAACPIPARIVGRSTSDTTGEVRIVLPR